MHDANPTSTADRFRPSDYSAALVKCLLDESAGVDGARVLDVGCGSGVLLAAAGAAGAAHLTGVDIEADAVAATVALLNAQELSSPNDIHQGELFAPVEDRQFDLVLANLPHFPMDPAAIDGRLASWSAGGANGRALLDQFIDGLPPRLAQGGRALIAHNAFIDLDATREKVTALGLSLNKIDSFFVPLPQSKLAVMTPDVLERETGKSVFWFGRYAFGEVAVLALSQCDAGDSPS